MPMIRPFAICFLRTIQKVGACSGLGLFSPVKYTNGREALAEIAKRYVPLVPLQVNKSSSFSG